MIPTQRITGPRPKWIPFPHRLLRRPSAVAFFIPFRLPLTRDEFLSRRWTSVYDSRETPISRERRFSRELRKFAIALVHRPLLPFHLKSVVRVNPSYRAVYVTLVES